MSGGEEVDGFVEGLKIVVKIEFMKSNVTELEDIFKIDLKIDSDLWRGDGYYAERFFKK